MGTKDYYSVMVLGNDMKDKQFREDLEKIFGDCIDMYIATVQKNLDELNTNIHRICSA